MASVDAIDALLLGGRPWNDYLGNIAGEVDLTFADLSRRDLSGRLIERCDFSGAQLEGANFDRAKLSSCNLSGANLIQASFVGSELSDVRASNLIADGAIVRKAVLNRVRLEVCKVANTQLDDCELRDCQLAGLHGGNLSIVNVRTHFTSMDGVRVERLTMRDNRWKDCELLNWSIDQIEMVDCVFNEGFLRNVEARAGSVSRTQFVRMRVERLGLSPRGVASRELDFSGSTLADVALEGIGLSTATMLESALVNCVWPKQKGNITSLGRYQPSPHLLLQPVQDLRGVPPVIRREVADAQYIVRLQEQSSKWAKVGLALWGVTTGFGQSLLRLSLTTLCLLFVGTLLLLAARNHLFGTVFVPELLLAAIGDSFGHFFALAEGGAPTPPTEAAVAALNRIFGFVTLGLWVSIGANRIGKLGAE